MAYGFNDNKNKVSVLSVRGTDNWEIGYIEKQVVNTGAVHDYIDLTASHGITSASDVVVLSCAMVLNGTYVYSTFTRGSSQDVYPQITVIDNGNIAIDYIDTNIPAGKQYSRIRIAFMYKVE